MRVADKIVQKRVALALAHLSSPDDLRKIFIENAGMIVLIVYHPSFFYIVYVSA